MTDAPYDGSPTGSPPHFIAMTENRTLPTLLWPSSPRVEYTHVPRSVEETFQKEFPQLRIVVARTEETFLAGLPDCAILVTAKIQPEQFALCRKLRWIHSPMAGVTSLLVPDLVASDIMVTNGRTVHSVPVAEQTLALMLALARRLPASFRFQAERCWGQDESWLPGKTPFELQEKTLGMVGLGAIGQELVPRAKALGMRVIAVRRNAAKEARMVDRGYPPAQLHEMLSQADFVVLAAPDTPEMIRLIGAAELQTMKPTAYLINVSRGTLVDTDALVKALRTGVIAGAGLDVTDPEPLPPEHPLWTLPNVLITPHLGGASDRFWERECALLRENLRRYLAAEPLLNLVDKRLGY
ncbi:MAG: D-2-hydroxyacid dehydrogenase [Acidobacteria bacterium]|nr:D-2-hydroxyacid dehydrogenase [Acidobacteriota bacterium]